MPTAADDHLRALRQAIDGLTYPSESDEPFELITWDQESTSSARDVLLAHVDRTRQIQQVTTQTFFSQLDAAENAERYRDLRRTLETLFRELSVFRVGAREVRVDVYIMGHLPAGGWIALHTVSVET